LNEIDRVYRDIISHLTNNQFDLSFDNLINYKYNFHLFQIMLEYVTEEEHTQYLNWYQQ
jgi:hypothetical protein